MYRDEKLIVNFAWPNTSYIQIYLQAMTITLLSLLPALDVTITVNYTRPPGSDLGTDEYRAASGPVTVTCNSGGAENVTYLWSSTCKNCVFDNSTEQKIFRAAVHSGDNGTHTCTVTMESNETVVGNASINFNIVGKFMLWLPFLCALQTAAYNVQHTVYHCCMQVTSSSSACMVEYLLTG